MDTRSWHAVMQAEDLDRPREALEAANMALAEAVGRRPLSQRQVLRAPNAESLERVVETAASLGIGSEYGAADVDTVISDNLIYTIRLAQYAGVDFRECVQKGLWEHGCDVIDDGSYMLGPRELIRQADGVAKDLASVGIDAAPEELRELGERLESGGVLEVSEEEASILAAVRDTFRARVETASAADGGRGNG